MILYTKQNYILAFNVIRNFTCTRFRLVLLLPFLLALQQSRELVRTTASFWTRFFPPSLIAIRRSSIRSTGWRRRRSTTLIATVTVRRTTSIFLRPPKVFSGRRIFWSSGISPRWRRWTTTNRRPRSNVSTKRNKIKYWHVFRLWKNGSIIFAQG